MLGFIIRNLLLIYSLLICIDVSHFKSIHVTLNSRWSPSSLLTQASEFIWDYDSHLFWTFFDYSIRKCNSKSNSDEDRYHCVMSFVEEYLPTGAHNLLAFSLSLQYYSAKIEMYQQIAKERILNQNYFKSSQACPVFVEINGKFVICDPKKVGTFRNISHSNLSSISQIYEFDHKFPIQTDIQSLHVILYGSLDYIITIHFHMEILKLVAENLISSYTFRHYITPEARITLLPLSGYGVELAIKSTEYKSVDDSMSNEELHSQENAESDLSGINFQILMKNKPELIEKLSQFELHQLKMLQDIPPLKPWQLQDLSLQACQYLLQNSNLTDDLLNKLVFISQYFPTNAKKLSQLNISPGLKTEIEYNQKIFSSNGLDEGETLLILNGVIYRDIDIFTLYKDFISEHKLFSYLNTLGIQIQDFEKILAISTKMDNTNYALDTRNESVVFINDISRDSAYSYWSSEITDILRPTFPGVIRQIRQNLFNLILFVNPADKSSLPYLQAVSIIINQKSPIRVGFVLTPIQKDTNNSSELLTFGFYFLVEKYSPIKAFKWLLSVHESNKDSLIEMANSEFLKLTGIILSSVEDAIKINILQSYYLSTGLTETPVALLNGIKMDIQDTNPDSIISSIRNVIYTETGTIQRDVYFGRYKKGQDVYDYLMSRSNVVRRLSKLILYSDTRTLLLTSQSFIPESSWLDSEITDEMPPTSITQLLLNTIPYVYNPKFEFQTKPLTILIVADFSTHHGFELLKSALHFINGSSHSRLALIYNPNSTEIESTDLNQLLMGLIYTQQQHKLLDILNTLIDFMSDDLSLTDDKIRELFGILSTNIKSFKNDKLINFMNVADLPISIQNYKTFLTRVLKLSPSELAVISNGRIYGPFNIHTDFTYDDFVFLEQLTLDLYGKELKSIIDDYELIPVGNATLEHDYMSDVNFKSDPLMKLASILTLYNNKDRTDFNTNDLRTSYSHLQLKPRDINSSVYFNLKLFIDPISKDGQKLLGMVKILHQRFNIFLQIWFNPIQHHGQIPLNRFYTYVLESEIQFDEEGNFITTSPCSEFIDIPETPLFTLSMDVPHQWMVEPMYSLYDLDNIHLQDVHNTLTANYELSHILIEGHCSSHTVRQPVPGLQFILGTDSLQNQYDSLVMANLGYFQLKATPGIWKMKLREGKSRDIYSILSHFGTSGFDNDYTVYVHIEDFHGKLLQIYVDKRPGQELNNLLDSEDSPKTDPEDDDSSFWEKISNAFLTQNEENVNWDNKSALQNVSTVINIFSIASGHLYERFLRIMMLSVLKNTNTPIKFWFLKNYLSPHFKQFIPYMSKFYSFQYEFVEYKWPQWLNSQSEKQRTIWGYKILFLDVLFPMDLKRIIFVDADQVVRTDLNALTIMDLEGAAYAYTPFCNSRKEMDGFRFWKQGYWRNVLYNREYHISALYVVDLLRFRKLGAGDRLRGQYQSLSHDPNSLANLDQDLPNSMIHSVPLFSLPREWLWCETWCSDVEKLAAKTIDLCNNPLTKEPKLQAAQRIIEEWSDYDNEIKLLLSNYTSLITPNATIPPTTTTNATDTKGKSDTHSHTEL